MTHLRTVTITGADDGVDPKDLVALSKEFPFVEWGILRSTKREGTPRYPTAAWRSELWVVHHHRMRFAAHLCGGLSLRAMAGIDTWRGETDPISCPIQYQRVQLNGFSGFRLPGLRVAEYHSGLEFILQCSDSAALNRAMDLGQGYPNVTALYDPSAGCGVRPSSWAPLASDVDVGYAGGIAPDNVVAALEELAPAARPYWIDMESGVRTDDRFDLDKVRRVLELAAPFVSAPDA